MQAVKDELAELEATAGARQSVSQMNTEITDLLELLTADSDTAWSDSELAQMQVRCTAIPTTPQSNMDAG